MQEGALVLYGRGGKLGNFKFFADDLVKQDLEKKFGKEIESYHVVRRTDAIDKIQKCRFLIKELHIFTHSIGGGLFLSYGEAAMGTARVLLMQSAARAGRRVTYDEVVNTEAGAILSDHLVRLPLLGRKHLLRAKFAKKAFIKIWGCNSGVSDWVYGDEPGTGYYWEALNEQNTPKPAVAQAIANFFGVETLGAGSGSSIQVKYKAQWIYADEYKSLTGRFAGEPEILRLNPTKGSFISYHPKAGP